MTRGAMTFIAIAALGCVVAVWLLLGPSDAGSSGDSPTSAVDVVQQFDPDEREVVTPFTATLLDGTALDSNDLRGQVTVFNVWGSWCGPCRAEAPDLVEASRRLGRKAAFYGINVRDSPDAARAFERAFEIPYPSVRADDSARTIMAFRGVLTAAAVPSTVVVDRNGAVSARVVGQVDASTLVGLVRDASDGANQRR